MNELVQRLTKEQPVETARPEKTAKALKECIDRDYVHVMFKKTGTEVGIQLDRRDCKFDEGNFKKAKGAVHLVGGLILNYDKVRCVADKAFLRVFTTREFKLAPSLRALTASARCISGPVLRTNRPEYFLFVGKGRGRPSRR
jgi:hypothetical protein